MSSMLDRVRVAVLGKMNDLLDEVANTPNAYKQRIRDLETAMADLRTAVDESVGTTNGYARQVATAQSRIASTQSDIDLLLGDDDPSNDDAALQMQVELEQLNGQIAQWQSLQADSESNTAQLNQALTQLNTKHQEMVNALNRLTLTAAASSAKNRAAAAVEAAVSASADSGEVDSIQARLDHDADVANARFARVVGGLQANQSPEQAAALARAKAAIAQRRTEIAAAAKQQPANAAS